MQEILSHLENRPIYLTFDVDEFDASLMPATDTPEPGSLFWDEVQTIITGASNVGKIVGADVNELAPIPHFHSCDFFSCKISLSYTFLSSLLRYTAI